MGMARRQGGGRNFDTSPPKPGDVSNAYKQTNEAHLDARRKLRENRIQSKLVDPLHLPPK